MMEAINLPQKIYTLCIKGQKNQNRVPESLKQNNLAEDWPDYVSQLVINLDLTNKNSKWLHYSLKFEGPFRTEDFTSESFLLCRKPIDELSHLYNEVMDFISNPKKNLFLFEPVEPCFELRLEKTSGGQAVKLYCWVDNGNSDLKHYTWDALGMRLLTDLDELEHFASQLKNLI
jgi:hypothetical protein